MLKPESMTRFEKMGSHFEGEGIPEEMDPRLQTMHSPSEQHQLYTYHQHQHAPIEVRQGMTSPLQPLSTTAQRTGQGFYSTGGGHHQISHDQEGNRPGSATMLPNLNVKKGGDKKHK